MPSNKVFLKKVTFFQNGNFLSALIFQTKKFLTTQFFFWPEFFFELEKFIFFKSWIFWKFPEKFFRSSGGHVGNHSTAVGRVANDFLIPGAVPIDGRGVLRQALSARVATSAFLVDAHAEIFSTVVGRR